MPPKLVDLALQHGITHLAFASRLPDIDESLVRRFTWSRLDSLQATTQHHLHGGP